MSAPHVIHGSVMDVGGGQVQVSVDRDTECYFEVGARVTLVHGDASQFAASDLASENLRLRREMAGLRERMDAAGRALEAFK